MSFSIDVSFKILAGILAIGIIIGNGTTIASFLKIKRLRSNPSYWYITSLAAADFLVGLITIPFALFNMEYFGEDKPPLFVCDAFMSVHVISVYPTFMLLSTISADRYYKLVNPLKYRRVMTIKKAVVIIIIIWLVSCGIAFVLVFPNHIFWKGDCLALKLEIFDYTGQHLFFILSLFVALPFIILMICNIKIYRIASNFKRVLELELRNRDIISNSDDAVELRYHMGRVIITTVSTDQKAKKLRFWIMTSVKQKKIALLILTIVSAAAICWVPGVIAYVITWFCMCGIEDLPVIRYLCPWLFYFNSVLNPVILLLMSDDFRRAFKKLYHL
jgi:hypothetical protein